MTESDAPTNESMGTPGVEDAEYVFVEEESLVVTEEDLFDVPTEAPSLPEKDLVDGADAMGTFEEAEAEPVTATKAAWNWSRWQTRTALAVLGLLNVVVIGAVLRKDSVPEQESAEPPPQEVAERPPQEIAEQPPAAEAPPPSIPAVAEARPPEARKPAPAETMPSLRRTGRDRLESIESALAAGRTRFARIELGRLLLDVDSLPEAEREEIRAQAELRLAFILQHTADEARGSPR